MPAVTTVYWAPQKLQASLKGAFVYAVKDAQKVAIAANPAPSHIKVMVPVLDTTRGYAVIVGKGNLAHIMEWGRQGGYLIAPGKRSAAARFLRQKGKGSKTQAIRFWKGDGGFYRGEGFRGGAMAARPYMRPAASAFVPLYRRRASSALGTVRL